MESRSPRLFCAQIAELEQQHTDISSSSAKNEATEVIDEVPFACTFCSPLHPAASPGSPHCPPPPPGTEDYSFVRRIIIAEDAKGPCGGANPAACSLDNCCETGEIIPFVNCTLEWGVVSATFLSVLSIVPRHCARLINFFHSNSRKSNAALIPLIIPPLRRAVSAPCTIILLIMSICCGSY